MMSRIVDRFNNRLGRARSPTDNIGARYTSLPHETVELEGLTSEENLESSGPTFTPDDAITYIGFGIFHIKLVLVLGLVWMVEGMEIFVMSVLAPYLRCHWGLSYYEETLLPILTSLGMMLSSPVWGWVCDVYGRKKGLYISSVWFIYFAFLSTFSPNYRWLLFLRFLVGVGIGSLPQVSTILAEYTPAKARGKVLTFITVFWSIGFIFAASLSLWLMIDYGFRVLLAALCVPGLLFLWSFYWMPESFRFYAVSGQGDKALEMLKHIAKANGSCLPPGNLTVTPVSAVKNRGSLIGVVRSGYFRMTVTLWLIWFISIMMYYSSVYVTTEIFDRYDDNICHETEREQICKCKVFTRKDYIDIIWTSVGEFPGVIITVLLIDWLGRKRTMYVNAFVAIGCQSLLFLCLNRTGATVLLMVTRCILVGYSAVVYVYTPEAYPTSIRAMGMGSGYVFGRIGMLVAPFIAEALFHVSFQATKFFFVFSLVIGFLAALSLPFDTMGKVLV
jgi:MFS family permease